VPLPNERIGDFSLAAAAAARVKYQTNCPGGAQFCYGTVTDPLTGAPFPENKIPAGRIEPIARRVLDLIPQANLISRSGALNANNYIYDGGIVGISISGGGIPSPASPARLGSPNFLPKWQYTNQYHMNRAFVHPRLQAPVRHIPWGLPSREYHIRIIMSETCQRRLC